MSTEPLHTPPTTTRRTASDTPSSLVAFVTSLLCLLAALFLARHHPLSPPLALSAVAALCALSLSRPRVWLWLVPAGLPVIDGAPWTGWITFEEFDILVLALAAGAYARSGWARPIDAATNPSTRRPRQTPKPSNIWAGGTVMLFTASVLLSTWRGMDDAGGFAWSWYQGYHEPLNSLRLAKGFLLSLLMWPLWRQAQKTCPTDAPQHLTWGLMLGLTGAGLAALWERLAFTGLLNFSTDYRTTALFWEMHVGGAALDGFLALTMPFALRELLAARSTRRWCGAAAVMLLSAYVCITTFSRGVYLAQPLALGLTAWLYHRQMRAYPMASVTDETIAWWPRIGTIAAFTLAAAALFPGSGYRGLLALVGATGLLMALRPFIQSMKRTQWITGAACGLLLCAVASGVFALWDKGAYIAYAMTAALATLMLWRGMRVTASRRVSAAAPWALGAYLATSYSLVLVAWHWGGEKALPAATLVAMALMSMLFILRSRSTWVQSAWPIPWRGQLSLLGIMAMCGGLIAVFGGGAYMGERFSTGNKDMAGRVTHWQLGLNALRTPMDWAWGKGQGRFPSNHYLSGQTTDQTGDYRLAGANGHQHLVMSAGKHMIGWGELFRMSQRIDAPLGVTTVKFNARVIKPVTLHFEVCEKHLLYNNACLFKQIDIKPADAEHPPWQALTLHLEGVRNPSRGDWYAPKLIMFSMGVYTNGAVAEVDELQLIDAQGDNLLRNGDFSEDLAHWFFTSDRHHMPWHIKSMFMHVLFDQGVVGLLLWLTLGSAALWRVTWGHARMHVLAPPVAGGLLGFAVVGLFDSLLDVPRVAFIFYLLMLLGLTLRTRTSPPNNTAER